LENSVEHHLSMMHRQFNQDANYQQLNCQRTVSEVARRWRRDLQEAAPSPSYRRTALREQRPKLMIRFRE
jgi:hypothetical protein